MKLPDEELHQRVIKALKDNPTLSYSKIGEMCGASKGTVCKIRQKYLPNLKRNTQRVTNFTPEPHQNYLQQVHKLNPLTRIIESVPFEYAECRVAQVLVCRKMGYVSMDKVMRMKGEGNG